jgi:hypothetical protein
MYRHRSLANCGIPRGQRSTAGIVVGMLGLVVLAPLNVLSWFVFTLMCFPFVGLVPYFIIWTLHFAAILARLPIEAILCCCGIMPEKLLRLRVIILRDRTGVETCGRDAVLAQLVQLIRVFKRYANVKVIPCPSRLPNARSIGLAGDYVVNDGTIARRSLLDFRVGPHWPLGISHVALSLRVCRQCFWEGWRRLAGFGSPVCVFAARSLVRARPPELLGFSPGAFGDYVIVAFARSELYPVHSRLVLAHEVGHLCLLRHSAQPGNLMNRVLRPAAPGARRLKFWQVIMLRVSTHVSYL